MMTWFFAILVVGFVYALRAGWFLLRPSGGGGEGFAPGRVAFLCLLKEK